MVASQLAGNMCLSNISSSTVPQPGFKAAQYNRLKRIQSYLMPLPQLQGVPFGSARDTLYYSSCLTCLFKDEHHHFCTRRYTAKRSDFHEKKSNHSGFAKEDDEHPKMLNITHLKSSRMHTEL